MNEAAPPFKREGDAVLVLVEAMGWISLGPAERVMEAMCAFLAAEDFGDRA